MLDISILFKIGAMGILLMIIDKVLKGAGKDEVATLCNLTGIAIILITVVGIVYKLFDSVKTLFTL